MDNLKKQVGIKAAEFVKSGMVVGLGTGSTAAYFVEELGRRIAEEQLEITGVTTSNVTSSQARALGIPLASIDEVDYIWIVDESKLSENLGSFKIPVEVIPYGSQQVFKKFEAAGYAPTWRLNEENERLITDMHHFIIDLHISQIKEPEKLAEELDLMVGVVEHGLFNNMVKKVIVAGNEGVRIINK